MSYIKENIMAILINTPRLEINIIDDMWAEIRAIFDVDWTVNRIDDHHRIVIEILGQDDGFAGG